MAVLRGNSGADKRFLIAGKVRGAVVRPWVAPELEEKNEERKSEEMDAMDRMDEDVMPVDADELYARVRKQNGNPVIALAVTVAAVEAGLARDVLVTPEAVAAA